MHELSQDVRLLYQILVGDFLIQISAVTQDDLSLDAFHHKHGDRPLLHELTELEMALLITARHLQLRDREPFTWEMCLEDLHQFVQRLQRDLNAVSMKSSSSIASANLDALNNRSLMMQVRNSHLT